jgi:hypothetical protein
MSSGIEQTGKSGENGIKENNGRQGEFKNDIFGILQELL